MRLPIQKRTPPPPAIKREILEPSMPEENAHLTNAILVFELMCITKKKHLLTSIQTSQKCWQGEFMYQCSTPGRGALDIQGQISEVFWGLPKLNRSLQKIFRCWPRELGTFLKFTQVFWRQIDFWFFWDKKNLLPLWILRSRTSYHSGSENSQETGCLCPGLLANGDSIRQSVI